MTHCRKCGRHLDSTEGFQTDGQCWVCWERAGKEKTRADDAAFGRWLDDTDPEGDVMGVR